MKKSILFLLPLLLLSSCQNVDTISSSSIDNETNSSSSKNDEPSSSNSNVSPSTSTTITPSTMVVTPSTNTITPFTPNQTSSSSSSEDEITYNPDGSQHLPVPQEHVKETWGTQEVKYSFLESFPEGFQYIYGHKILNQPNFYQDGTKGWKVTIDGKEAKTHKIGDAFLGVNIYSGKHKVSLKYTPPGFTVGWKITVLSAAIFLILCKIIHSRKLRQLHASDFVRRF